MTPGNMSACHFLAIAEERLPLFQQKTLLAPCPRTTKSCRAGPCGCGKSEDPGCECLACRSVVSSFPTWRGKKLDRRGARRPRILPRHPNGPSSSADDPVVTDRDVLSRRQAWTVFEKLLAYLSIRQIDEPPGVETLWTAFSKRDDKSHLLWTDDYLAALTQAADAEFVTFDRACVQRYPSVRVICLR